MLKLKEKIPLTPSRPISRRGGGTQKVPDQGILCRWIRNTLSCCRKEPALQREDNNNRRLNLSNFIISKITDLSNCQNRHII